MTSRTTAMSFVDVTYTYPLTDEPTIRNASFSIERGRCYGLVGANGAGKTTLCSIARGLCPSFFGGELTGSIQIDGTDLAEWDPADLGIRVGLIFQDPFAQISGVKETVFEEIGIGLENLGVPLAELTERVVAAAELVGVADLLERDPKRLSGGQCQRVAFASVLVLEAQILVVDEPTSQLDPEGSAQIFKILRDLADRGTTILLAEHKIDQLANLCDELIVVRDGEIVLTGPTDAVLTDPSLARMGVGAPVPVQLGRLLEDMGIEVPSIPTNRADGIALVESLIAGAGHAVAR